jgi:hypothetical protein
MPSDNIKVPRWGSGRSSTGLLFGSTNPDEKEAKDLTCALTREFIARSVQKNGTVSCTELLGCDISTDKGLARARPLTRTLCPRYVNGAVEILEEVLTPVTSGRPTRR